MSQLGLIEPRETLLPISPVLISEEFKADEGERLLRCLGTGGEIFDVEHAPRVVIQPNVPEMPPEALQLTALPNLIHQGGGVVTLRLTTEKGVRDYPSRGALERLEVGRLYLVHPRRY